MHFISFPISVFLLDCISFFCTSVFLLHCISLYFFAAQCSWRRGSKSLVQLLMLDKWSSPLGPLRTYTLIYFWSPPFISWNNSLKFSIYSNGKMRSPSVRPTEDLYSHLGNNLKESKKMCPSLTPRKRGLFSSLPLQTYQTYIQEAFKVFDWLSMTFLASFLKTETLVMENYCSDKSGLKFVH